MLIDLLDKKASEENSLALLKELVSSKKHSVEQLNALLTQINQSIDNIRDYSLLISREKSRLEAEISGQKFNLNELDCLSDSIKEKIRVLDLLIFLDSPDVDIFELYNKRTDIQKDLDLINKASDIAIWRDELSVG